MNKAAVIINYSRTPDNELGGFSQGVYNSLNPNTNFVWQAGVMDSFEKIKDDYKKKLEKASSKATSDVLAKNIVRRELIDILRKMATDVNAQADGDVIKLQSSGFTLCKERAKVGVLPKPTNFEVSAGLNKGDILFSVDTNNDAKVYCFFSAPDPVPADMSEWRLINSTTHKKNVSGYIHGKRYGTCSAYQGSADKLVYSDIKFIYIQ